mmetsp:Transcript_28086/g.24814  ORF Transcript_28086/g.24814 Transcript_28086/m.24814 type:complete len:299 (-) Transcript_28086:1916-2812(-)
MKNGMTTDEVCIRQLADTFFLLQDYENAFSNYKLLSSDLKSKNQTFYSNCLEMMNICQLLLEQNYKKDISFRKCFDLYLESWDSAKFSIRAIIFLLHNCVINNQKDEIGCLLDGAKRYRDLFPILNCIFYEQYALSYIKISPLWPRKYAFSMVLAGYTYNQANLRKYGQRCYQLSSIIYHNTDWSMIQEHVNTILGKNSFQNGDPVNSICYYRKAVENMKESDTADRHSNLIRETLAVISHVQGEKIKGTLSPEDIAEYYEEISKFPFPKIVDETFDITIADDYFNFINDLKTNKVYS